MNNELPTKSYASSLSSPVCQKMMPAVPASTGYILNTIDKRRETSDERRPFMQNEPNFQKSQMNVTDVLTREYEQMDTWWGGKKRTQNEPNQSQFPPKRTQFKPNFHRAQDDIRHPTYNIRNTNPICWIFK